MEMVQSTEQGTIYIYNTERTAANVTQEGEGYRSIVFTVRYTQNDGITSENSLYSLYFISLHGITIKGSNPMRTSSAVSFLSQIIGYAPIHFQSCTIL